ncbi:MAG: isochorismatase family protein [Chloroflexota bacterium]|jgi:nicotinamidase/pyrazinamidase
MQRRRALVIVDMQRDFAHLGGSLFIPRAPEIVPTLIALIEEARREGAPIAWSQDWHPSQTPHFNAYGGTWPAHCIAGSAGAELIPELEPLMTPEDIVIRKGVNGEDGYSAFNVRDPLTAVEQPTELDTKLQELKIELITIAGVATDWCVRASALDALKAGYAVEVVRAAVAGVNLQPADSDAALYEIAAAGGVIRS